MIFNGDTRLGTYYIFIVILEFSLPYKKNILLQNSMTVIPAAASYILCLLHLLIASRSHAQ